MVSETTMGMSPDHWGPYVWASIHLICLGAPETIDTSQQQAYRTFFSQLPYVIPCATCARHLQENLVHVPIDEALTGREALFAWSVKLHNLVNTQLKKPTITLEEARKHWMTTCPLQGPAVCVGKSSSVSKHTMSVKNTLLLFLLGVLIGVGITYGMVLLNREKRRS